MSLFVLILAALVNIIVAIYWEPYGFNISSTYLFNSRTTLTSIYSKVKIITNRYICCLGTPYHYTIEKVNLILYIYLNKLSKISEFKKNASKTGGRPPPPFPPDMPGDLVDVPVHCVGILPSTWPGNTTHPPRNEVSGTWPEATKSKPHPPKKPLPSTYPGAYASAYPVKSQSDQQGPLSFI